MAAFTFLNFTDTTDPAAIATALSPNTSLDFNEGA
jgi:hypothetical protein